MRSLVFAAAAAGTVLTLAAPSPAVAKGGRRGPQGRVPADTELRQTPLPPPSGNLHLFNVSGQDEIKINIFNPDHSYNSEALASVSHLLRCRRTDEEKPIEPRLMVILSHIYDHFGRRIEVLSGFRNQRRQTSYHFKGSASDIRIAGVAPKTLRKYAESLDTGGMGVGIYPTTGFVHVDVRPPPSYRWVDWAHSNPNSKDKQPPRGWRRKVRAPEPPET